eukprot:CAMPEP_0185182630 /NCGR_PEP_ID=MMETSP1140-20130426/1469_1 /TAXON_ID=298111 /ORGANISM="Pavlova sp., Strain CCMP459" /LENGTH=608 /DNA_ID=CAMNT_0027748589 /DNA_START=83 /DNA_END=1909 /DNA_ORIENTATION=+
MQGGWAAPDQSMSYNVVIPPGVQAGEAFLASCGGQMVRVIVPAGLGPGEQVRVQVAGAVQAEPAYAPNEPQVPPFGGPPGMGMEPPPPAAETQAGAHEQQQAEDPPSPTFSLPQVDEQPPRWSHGAAGLVSTFKLSLSSVLFGLVLVVAGKGLQETFRPVETQVLWEVALCCGKVVNNSTPATCAEWVGRYDGPGSLCPNRAVSGETQSWTIPPEDLRRVPFGREYYLVAYVTSGAGASLDYSLKDADGQTALGRFTADLSAVTRRRRLAALPIAGVSARDSAGRELLKGGSGGFGGWSTGSTGSGGSGGRSSGGGRASSSSAGGSRARTYASTARTTAYGSRGSRNVVAGAYLASSARRRPSQENSAHSKEEEDTVASEDMDRVEVVSPSFRLSRSQTPLPLELIAHAVSVTTIPPRFTADAPYVFLGLYSAPDLRLYDAGIALWAIGTSLFIFCPIVYNLVLFAVWINRANSSRRRRYAGTITACKRVGLIIGVTLFITGIAAFAIGGSPTVEVGVAVFLAGFVVSGITYQLEKSGRFAGGGAHQPSQLALILNFAGLCVTCVSSVAVDAEGVQVGNLIALLVGILILLASLAALWRDVKYEHMKR